MSRKSILVVDDEKSQREILEMILSGEGYDVTTASSGNAAMKFVADRHFDLVLTDLKMPGMSGLELLKELTDFDKSIIVVLLTAHGSVDSAVDALQLGAFDYLQKALRSRCSFGNDLPGFDQAFDSRCRDHFSFAANG